MLVPSTKPVQLDIDSTFVPVSLRLAPGERLDHHDLIQSRCHRTLIVGDPGSGKSSLLKRVFRDASRQAATSPRRAQVPFIYELKHFPGLAERAGGKPGHDDLLADISNRFLTAAVYRAQDAFVDLAAGSGYLILLDGLDEVPAKHLEDAIDCILSLSEHLEAASPQSNIVVSSRSQQFNSLESRDLRDKFRALFVDPFDQADIYTFLKLWPFNSESGTHVTRLLGRLVASPSLREMCTNPLVLAMFVARDQETGGSAVAETRSTFYRLVCDELVIDRRYRREGQSLGRGRLLNLRQQILGEVCLGHILSMDESPNSIPWSRFLDAATAVSPEVDAEQATLELSVDTGLFIQERHQETARFLHLTLCEFLAAQEVVERGDSGWQEILDALDASNQSRDARLIWDGRLADVIAFACGLASRSMQDEILRALNERGRLDILLRAAAECQRFENPDVASGIATVARELLDSYEGSWDVEWLSRFRLLVALLRESGSGILDPSASRRPLSGSGFVRELILRHGGDPLLISSLAHFDVAAALEMAEGSPSHAPRRMRAVASEAADYAVLEGVLMRSRSGVQGWREALIEQAMFEPRLARILLGSKDHVAWPDSQGHGWANSYLTRDCTMSMLLDTVSTDGTWSDDMRTVVKSLSRVQPPRNRWTTWLRSQVPGALALLALTPAVLASSLVAGPYTLILVTLLVACLGFILVYLTQGARIDGTRPGMTKPQDKQKSRSWALKNESSVGERRVRECVYLEILNVSVTNALSSEGGWRGNLRDIVAWMQGVKESEATTLKAVRRMRLKRLAATRPDG